ncbi:hypothetical protein NDI45_24080 [Leptolyngbya sp. GB1-A1]
MFRSNTKFKEVWDWSYIIPLLISITLIVACVIVSFKKYYWNDELYSYYFLSDPSFSHMLAAFNDKINNTPILYFLFGWVWARFFGIGELSLRLFSCLGLCVAAIITWITLRRTYRFLPSALGLLTVFCTSGIILDQNAEARMYGLFLAVCSLGLLQFDILNRSDKLNRWGLLCNTFIHAAIVHTHLFGIFYSGAIFLTQLVWDAYCKVFKTRIYLSIILGCLSLIFYIPTLLIQADAGRPRTWIPIPALNNLTSLMNLSSSSFFQARALGWIILTASSLLLLKSFRQNDSHFNHESFQNQQRTQRTQRNLELPLLLFALSFLLVPIFVWLISRTVKPIFIERYLIPSCLSWIILIAFASSHFVLEFQTKFGLENVRRSNLINILKKLASLILCTILITYFLSQPIKFARSFTRQELHGTILQKVDLSELDYRNLPVAIQFSSWFTQIFHYSSERYRHFFILDWEAAVNENSGSFTPQEYKHLDALKRVYPERFRNNIIQSDDFLQNYDRFLVIDERDYRRKCPLKSVDKDWEYIQCPQWLEMRILANPAYRVKPLVTTDWETVLLVEKVS